MPLSNNEVFGFEKEDEKQEFQLGRLIFLQKHPLDERRNADLKGYRRLVFHKRRMAKWRHLRVAMIDEIIRDDEAELGMETMLVREILSMLPLAVKKEVLRALASDDGRMIRKAARLVREAKPELVAKERRILEFT